MKSRLPSRGFTAVAVLTLIWYGATAAGLVRSEFLPPPDEVLRAGAADWSELTGATLSSLRTAFVGYTLGFLGAALVGMVVGRFAIVDSWASGTIDFFRAIPAVAIVPLAIVWFADSILVGAFAVAWGCFNLAVINVIAGVRQIPTTLQDAARTFGAGEVKILRTVGIPSLLPYFLSSLRQNVSVALIVIVVADMVIGLSGLGFYILRNQGSAQFGRMYAAIVVISILGYATFSVLEAAQKRLFPWWSESLVRQ